MSTTAAIVSVLGSGARLLADAALDWHPRTLPRRGAAVEGAYITTEDFKTFQLVKTDDGTVSGNVTQTLATCTR